MLGFENAEPGNETPGYVAPGPAATGYAATGLAAPGLAAPGLAGLGTGYAAPGYGYAAPGHVGGFANPGYSTEPPSYETAVQPSQLTHPIPPAIQNQGTSKFFLDAMVLSIHHLVHHAILKAEEK